MLGGFNLVAGVVVVFLAIEATVELVAVFDTLSDPTVRAALAEYVGASLFAAGATCGH